MCDPISIGLAAGGAILKSVAAGQVAGAQKKDIAAAGASYEAERARQAGFNETNQKTVADTLDNYSRGNFDATNSANIDKRQTAYVAPIGSVDFGAAPVATGTSSAVANRNAKTADAAKSYSLGQAIAKAKLDAYGDTQQALGLHSADNANNIGLTNRIASNSQRAEAMQQGTLQSKLQADQSKGSTLGGLGDLFTAAGMIASMGGGSGLFGAGKAAALPGNPGFVNPFSSLPRFSPV